MDFNPQPTQNPTNIQKKTIIAANPSIDYDTSCGRGNFDEGFVNDYDKLPKYSEKKQNQNSGGYRGNNAPITKSKSMDIRSQKGKNRQSSNNYDDNQSGSPMVQSSSISDLDSQETGKPKPYQSPHLQRMNSTNFNPKKGVHIAQNNRNNQRRPNYNKYQPNQRNQTYSAPIINSTQSTPPSPVPQKEPEVHDWSPKKR